MSADTPETNDGLERRKHGYADLEKKVNAHFDYLEGKLRRNLIKGLIACSIIGFTSCIALAGFGILLRKEGHNSDEIQKQRYTTIYENCVAQNIRHNNTIERAQSTLNAEGAKAVLLLVDQLQPFVDNCKALAESRVPEVK